MALWSGIAGVAVARGASGWLQVGQTGERRTVGGSLARHLHSQYPDVKIASGPAALDDLRQRLEEAIAFQRTLALLLSLMDDDYDEALRHESARLSDARLADAAVMKAIRKRFLSMPVPSDVDLASTIRLAAEADCTRVEALLTEVQDTQPALDALLESTDKALDMVIGRREQLAVREMLLQEDVIGVLAPLVRDRDTIHIRAAVAKLDSELRGLPRATHVLQAWYVAASKRLGMLAALGPAGLDTSSEPVGFAGTLRLVRSSVLERLPSRVLRVLSKRASRTGAIDIGDEAELSAAGVRVHDFSRSLLRPLLAACLGLSILAGLLLFRLISRGTPERPDKVESIDGTRSGVAVVDSMWLEEGRKYSDRGLVGMAEDQFLRGLENARERGDKATVAAALKELAVNKERAGELQDALELYHAAQDLSYTIGDREGSAIGEYHLGRIHDRLGNRDRAGEYYQKALRMAHQIGNRRLVAQVLSGLGQHSLDGAELEEARRHFETALHLAREVGEPAIEATALRGMGELFTAATELELALSFYFQALDIWQQLQRTYEQAETLDRLGVAQRAVGNHSQAEAHFLQALELDRAIGNPIGEMLRLRRIAGLMRDRGELQQARVTMSEALKILESVSSRLVSVDLRAGFVGQEAEHYLFYVDLLMELAGREPGAGYEAAAFAVSERFRTRSLLQALDTNGPEIRRSVSAELLEREAELKARINGLVWYLGHKGEVEPAEGAEARRELEQLHLRYKALEAEISRRSFVYTELTEGGSLSLDDVQQQLLDPDTVLLHYHLGRMRSFLWVVKQDSLSSYTLPPPQALEQQAARVYELLTARNQRLSETREARQGRLARADAEYVSAAGALGQALLGPASAELDRNVVLISADGAINYVPFAALPDLSTAGEEPSVPLVASHEVVNVPSASVVAALRRRTVRASPGEVLAVFADPVFQQNDPRVRTHRWWPFGEQSQPSASIEQADDLVLRSVRDLGLNLTRLDFSRREANLIAELAPRSGTLKALDFTASREAVTASRLGGYRYLHFATHALLNDRHPELSGIVLSLVDKAGRPRDGFLRQHDILNLELQADLVVLSACRTALGREVRGEGLLGLPRAFMFAGAPRVLASLWDVDDRSTSRLMVEFYEAVLKEGLPPATALRRAQLSMRQQGRPDYEWAGFVMEGEWRASRPQVASQRLEPRSRSYPWVHANGERTIEVSRIGSRIRVPPFPVDGRHQPTPPNHPLRCQPNSEGCEVSGAPVLREAESSSRRERVRWCGRGTDLLAAYAPCRLNNLLKYTNSTELGG